MSNAKGLGPPRIGDSGLTFFFGWACFALAVLCSAASVEGGAGAFAFASVFFTLSIVLLGVGLLTSLFQRLELRLMDIQNALLLGASADAGGEKPTPPTFLDDALNAALDLRD